MKLSRRYLSLLASVALVQGAFAQIGPNITSWKFNTTGATYFDPNTSTNIETDVQEVWYTTTNVYIKSNGIPSYYVVNLTVNDAADQDWVFSLPRNPVEKTGTKTAVNQGQIGVYVDGSCFFHPGDAQSYNNQGKWNRVAYFFEKPDFDSYQGHSTPSPSNTYHHHVANTYYNSTDSTKHSPLVGFAWDGFPIYGPFGYKSALDASSGITRMTSSYQERNMTTRTTLPNGTAAAGPNVSGTYPLGCFIEDYEYKSGSGLLDSYNGRFCKTPEYPNGTYAYFTTVNKDLTADYPYFLGTEFYGTVQNGNTGPTGGSFTIPGTATKYNPSSGVEDLSAMAVQLDVRPNPVSDKLMVSLPSTSKEELEVKLWNSLGQQAAAGTLKSGEIKFEINVSDLPAGQYFLSVVGSAQRSTQSIVIVH